MPCAPRSRPSRPPSIASAVRSRHFKAPSSRPARQLASADAGLKRAGLDYERQQALSAKGFASRATFEVSEAGRDQGAAAVKSAQAAYDAARDNVEVTKAQQEEARAQLAELQTSLAKAERDPRLHVGAGAGRRHVLQSPGLNRRLHRGSGSGSAMWCRSMTSSSMPISRRRNSSVSARASR